MKVVVFAPYAIPTPHFETDLELVHHHLDAGDEVTMLVCAGQLEACDPNPHHDLSRCLKCRARRRVGAALLPSAVRIEPFLKLTEADQREAQSLRTAFSDIEDLKRYRIGAFDAGYAALSSLVGLTRDPQPDLQRHAILLARLLRAGWAAYRSLQNYLRENDVDRVYLFNGRFAPLRGALRACQEQGVPAVMHERGCDVQHYALFHNTLPHDLEYVEEEIRRLWAAAAESSERDAIARRWYDDRARGVAPAGQLVFTQQQRFDALPPDWDANRRNVAIYISSEDEFEAIGDSWRNPLYASQQEGLRAILASLSSAAGDVHLYLRVHPNLARLDNSQTRGLAELSAPFLTVIPADAVIDTYALMRSADVTLSFGSTAGIEAAYWGRPSILAGRSFYANLGSTYNPQTHDELVHLLRTPLPPLPIDGALMYGYYLATMGQPYRYFQGEAYFRGLFKGRRIRPAPWDHVGIALADVAFPRRLLRRARGAIC